MATLTVPARFNGPPASGNGGYSCGVVAAFFDGPCAVSLRRPVPLDEPLEVSAAEDGTVGVTAGGEATAEDEAVRATAGGEATAGDAGKPKTVRALAGDELIAEATSAPPLAPWSGPSVDIDAARAARERYAAPADGIFSHCFVCGRAREDGLHVFCGPLAPVPRPAPPVSSQFASDSEANCELTRGVVASPWTPPDWAADADGVVRPEFVWAALDCPGYFALHGADMRLAYLARQQVEIRTVPRAGVEYVVVGRPLECSGRKGLAATAVLDPDGAVLAHAECLLVEPRESMSHR